MTTTLRRPELRDTEALDDQISRSAAMLADYVPDFETDSESATAQRPADRTNPQPLPQPTRRRWSVSWSALLVLFSGLLASGLCLYQAKSSWRPAVRPIQDYRVGQAVRSENPTGEEDLSLSDHVDPPTWRHLVLKAPKTDGSYADVELLRPLWWLEEREAKVGEFIDIDVPHCGIEGEAEVLAIKPCLSVEPASKGYRTVTGTFRHYNAEVIDFYVEGLDEPIGTTPNHLFWSDEQGHFVRADALHPRESIKGSDGAARNFRGHSSASHSATVFNLEVQGSHTYCVSLTGLVVHNAGDTCPKATPKKQRRTYVTYTADDYDFPGKTYVGRTSGPVGMSVDDILARRQSGHHRNLGPLQPDEVTSSYNVVRGREQQLRDRAMRAGVGTEQINPINPDNPRRKKYLDAARRAFGGLEE